MNASHRPTGSRTPRASLRFALAALAVAALFVTSCERGTPHAFLSPTGQQQEESDTEVFTSIFDVIQLLGTPNAWDEQRPSMDLVGNGLWEDRQLVSAGSHTMKLRTELTWDEPPDFGCCDDSSCDPETPVPDDGTPMQIAVCERTGFGGDIPISFPVTGQYVFQFDEDALTLTVVSVGAPVPLGTLTGTVAFAGTPLRLPVATITIFDAGTAVERGTTSSDANNGSWTVDGLPSGSYDVAFQATAYESTTVTGVMLTAPGTATVPVVTMVRLGAVTGTVAFGGAPMPVPVATVTAFETGTTTERGTTSSDAGDGSWTVEGLSSGDYDLGFQATGFADTTITGIAVAAPGTTSVPQVTMEPLPIGTLEGVVSFSDSPSPRPSAAVTVFESGTTNQVGAGASQSSDGRYAIANLLEGTYDVTFTAPDYADTTVTGVAIVRQQTTALDVTLEIACASTIQIVGDFNGWDESAPPMGPSSLGSCVFEQTVSIAAGIHRIKLRTDNDWDETPDYGCCPGPSGCGTTLSLPNIFPVCTGVGIGDSIELDVTVSGNYDFTFDELQGILRIFPSP